MGVFRCLVLTFFVLAAFSARAQEQENKLVNRLLRPDMSLGNSAQNKSFSAGGSSLNKKAAVRTFGGARSARTRSFSGQTSFAAPAFGSQPFQAGDTAANLSTRNSRAPGQLTFDARTPVSVPRAREASRTVGTPGYPGNRPFTGEGKSQKSLHAQDAPMTIEQVRELLNRNK